MYVKLADIYDAAHHFLDYGKAAVQVGARIRDRHPGARTLLEVACGTGRYLEHFAAGFTVEGLDLSAEMLARAKERLPAVPLHQADMSSFSLGQQYDVVCCLFRSIGYARTTDRLNGAVASMAAHLAPGGLLVIEPFFTPETYWVDRITLNEYKSDELKIAWMYTSERTDFGARFRINYLVGTPAGVEHFVEDHEFGLFAHEDFARAFAAAGMHMEFEPGGPTGTGIYFGRKA